MTTTLKKRIRRSRIRTSEPVPGEAHLLRQTRIVKIEGVFLDTSGLFAVFHRDDVRHDAAGRAWESLLRSESSLHTSSYVLVELTALLQRRLGVDAVDALTTYVLPWVNVVWVDESLHREATAGLLAARRRDLALVDCASFAVMRRLGLRRVFTFDGHFAEQGFELLPV
ncbi:MAG: PIN domain-containing protein [Thermoleophilia bacterium]|nr:PIN domain-containing protein [Thermoleophilia bacterium]